MIVVFTDVYKSQLNLKNSTQESVVTLKLGKKALIGNLSLKPINFILTCEQRFIVIDGFEIELLLLKVRGVN